MIYREVVGFRDETRRSIRDQGGSELILRLFDADFQSLSELLYSENGIGLSDVGLTGYISCGIESEAEFNRLRVKWSPPARREHKKYGG